MKNFLYAIFYEMIKIINWLISIRHLYLRKSRYLVQVRYRLYQVFRYQVQVKVKNEIHFINLIMVPFYRSHWIKPEYIYCFLWLFKTFSQKWPKARCEFFYYVWLMTKIVVFGHFWLSFFSGLIFCYKVDYIMTLEQSVYWLKIN